MAPDDELPRLDEATLALHAIDGDEDFKLWNIHAEEAERRGEWVGDGRGEGQCRLPQGGHLFPRFWTFC
jgi:hypothetical protein